MKYSELLNSLKSNNLLEEIKDEYSEYSNKYKKPTENIFKTINMREDSHSILLLWLLNANGKDENSLQYRFLKMFIKLLDDLECISDVDIDALASDIEVTTQQTYKPNNKGRSKYMDIFLCSENTSFICVIENKLDARVNVDNDGVTQLEYYYDFINKQEKYKNKLCLYLCSDTKKTNSDLLDNYETIEHSDIALILYQTLLSYDGFDCDAFMENENRETFLTEIKAIKPNKNLDRDKFDEFMEKLSLDEQLEFLREYVQYWEFYAKFVDIGYSKIMPTKITDEGVTQYVYIRDVENLLNP